MRYLIIQIGDVWAMGRHPFTLRVGTLAATYTGGLATMARIHAGRQRRALIELHELIREVAPDDPPG